MVDHELKPTYLFSSIPRSLDFHWIAAHEEEVELADNSTMHLSKSDQHPYDERIEIERHYGQIL